MGRMGGLGLAAIVVAACSTVLACLAVFAYDHFSSGDPIYGVAGVSVVLGVGSIFALTAAGRAAARACVDQARPFLACAVLVLALLGFGLGLWSGMKIVREAHERSDNEAFRLCAVGLGAAISGPALDRCLPVAARCNRSLRDHPPQVRRGLDLEPDPALADLPLEVAAGVHCLRDRGVGR